MTKRALVETFTRAESPHNVFELYRYVLIFTPESEPIFDTLWRQLNTGAASIEALVRELRTLHTEADVGMAPNWFRAVCMLLASDYDNVIYLEHTFNATQ